MGWLVRGGFISLEEVATWQKRTFCLVAIFFVFAISKAAYDAKAKTSIESRLESLEYSHTQQAKRNAAQDEVNEILLKSRHE